MLPADQRRAAYAKKGHPAKQSKRAPLSKAFTHEAANDVRLTVQERLLTDYAERDEGLTLEAVEAALVEEGMPESWAESQAPLLHEELVRELAEDRKSREAEHELPK
jgi:hypothetical protein